MNEITLTLSQEQISLILGLLNPYTELAASISSQSRKQYAAGAAEIPHAKKIEDTKETQ